MEKTEKEVKVSKITIDIGGKVIELTVAETKKLKDSLDELFRGNTIYIEKYPYLENPSFPLPSYPAYPTSPYPTGPGDYPLPNTWCGVGDGTWTLKIGKG